MKTFTDSLESKVLRLCAIFLIATSVSSKADTFGSGGNTFSIDFVSIGNVGNANDSTGFGGVSYGYNMAVTAVSQTMIDDATALTGLNFGGGAFTGSQPATFVTWYEAAAFVNWLNTSQGYTTAYNLLYTGNTPTGITLQSAGNEWVAGGINWFRNANARYFLQSENEYYKAAYYSPEGVFYQYAFGSNSAPIPVLSGTTPGTAVYTWLGVSPVTAAPVDQSGGLSPYGTQGQTGNVFEWMETSFNDTTNSSANNNVARAERGGVYWGSFGPGDLQSSSRNSYYPSETFASLGFRVVSIPQPVPEPSTISLIGIGITGMIWMRRKRG